MECFIHQQLLNDEFSLGNVFAMLIVDTFLYGILTWYIEHVFPGSYGLPRPWYFPFQISYWIGADPKTCSASINCKRFYSRMSSLDAESTSPEPSGLLAMDAEPVHLPLGVVIEDLVKVFFLQPPLLALSKFVLLTPKDPKPTNNWQATFFLY